jgi:hypothetical protein
MNIVPIAMALVVCFALASWLSALVHWVWSLGHLSGKASLGEMLLSGIKALDSENFSERGRVLQKRFFLSFAAFFASIVLGGLAIVLLTSNR